MNLQYQMKTMLNEKAALLQKHDAEFFRKKVRNHNADTIKSKRETREIFTDSKKSFPWSPSYPLRRSEGQKKGGGSNYGKFNNGSSRFHQQTQKVSKDMGMVNTHSSGRTFFNMDSVSETSLKWDLENVHPLIKRLFSSNKVPNIPIAGRLKHFSKAWKKLTRDQSILDLVDGYVIPFQRKPFQSKIPFQLATSREQQKLLDKEVKEMLKKGAIRQVSTVKGEFLSNLFLVKKKDGGKGQ